MQHIIAGCELPVTKNSYSDAFCTALQTKAFASLAPALLQIATLVDASKSCVSLSFDINESYYLDITFPRDITGGFFFFNLEHYVAKKKVIKPH